MNILMVANQPPGSPVARGVAGETDTVHYAASVRQALAGPDGFGADLLVLDLESDVQAPLPQIAHARAKAPDLPILVLVGRADPTLSLAALELGAHEVLEKNGLTGDSIALAAMRAVARARHERDGQYRRIIELAGEGVWSIDLSDRTVFANRRMTQLLGYTLEELTGKLPRELLASGDDAAGRPCFSARMPADQRHLELCWRRKDGSLLWTTMTVHPRIDGDGHPQGAVALVTDIGERKSKEEALHRLASLVESSIDAIIAVDLEGKVLSWNRAAELLYGYPAGEAVGRSIRFIVPPDRQLEIDGILTRLRKGESIPTFETVRRHKDGHATSISIAISPIRDAQGRLVAASGIVRDISAQLKLQEQFRQAQKMEAIGRLAGGVAHDFNNLLTVICGYASLLLGRTDGTGTPKDELEEINRAGERAAGLTRQLLAFSRKQVLNPQVTSLNPMIKDLEKMLRRLIGEDVALSTVLQEDLGKVRVDLGQMEQVIMNLAVNARDAMPQGGRLIIETRNALLGEGTVGGNPEIPPGAYVCLAVSDTGIGMDREVQSHLFEPFFTTKGVGKGTGLGLSTIYGIVRQSGGHISVYSEPGRGSCFKIYLPNTTAAAHPLPVVKPVLGSLRGTESIMVVEDNEMVRRLTCDVLTGKGYHVRSAPEAEAALEVFAAEGFPDLLLTDMVLPGMNGLALCRAAAGRKCGIKRLLMTGYTEEAILHQGVSESGLPLLHKPFSPVELLMAVRGVLGTPAPEQQKA